MGTDLTAQDPVNVDDYRHLAWAERLEPAEIERIVLDMRAATAEMRRKQAAAAAAASDAERRARRDAELDQQEARAREFESLFRRPSARAPGGGGGRIGGKKSRRRLRKRITLKGGKRKRRRTRRRR